MPSDPKQLDTQIEIVTPENIAFRYRVAGPFRRLPAYLIDLAIRVGVGDGGACFGLDVRVRGGRAGERGARASGCCWRSC